MSAAGAGGPRIPPLRDGGWDGEVEELLAPWRTADGVPNPFATLARNPALLRAWAPFAKAILLEGTIAARERELLIMRTAVNCRCAYIWGSHATSHGPAAGLSDEEIARVAAGPDAGGWTRADAALLRAADQLHAGARISDEVWSALAAFLDERRLIELPMLVGEYHLMAFTFNALGVAPEAGFPPLP
jgi:alkylhydroperoxidase family enzyme